MEQFETRVTSSNQTNLHLSIWKQAQSKGLVLITHGLGEHGECYGRLINGLREMPLSYAAWDLPGHGRSDGKRGTIRDFTDTTRDLKLVIEKLKSYPEFKNLPLVLIGHSMGGLIVCRTLLASPEINPELVILSSPFLGMSLQVPQWKLLGSKILNIVAPEFTLGDEILPTMISRDPIFLKEHAQDVLRHHQISSRWFLGALDAIEYVQSRAQKWNFPTVLQVPRRDEVVSTASSLSFAERIQSSFKNVHVYPDRKHEIYNDLGREDVFADLKISLSSALNL